VTSADQSSTPSNAIAWIVAVSALAVTGSIPLVLAYAPARFAEIGVLLAAASASAGLLLHLQRRRRFGPPRAETAPGADAAGGVRGAVDLALHLWPVGLLTVVFPVAAAQMGTTTVGNTGLTTLLLAVSLTVPWLSQGACLSLYRAVGPLVGDQAAMRRRFCGAWPAAFVSSLALIVLFAVPVQLMTGWSSEAMTAYVVSCALHTLFAQSLVLINLDRSRWLWALVWTAYALPLLAAPTIWYLPPLIGLLPQLLVLRYHLVARPSRLVPRDEARDLVRGLLLGSVLWADKFCFFLVAGSALPVESVFLALLPAVIAYNYYFVRLAPDFDTAVDALRDAMERRTFDALSRSSSSLFVEVKRSVARTGSVGAVLVLALSWTIVGFRPTEAGLVVAIAVASWLFMTITVAAYKMDYIGQQRRAQLWSGLHLVLCVATFAAIPAGPGTYVVLIGVDALLLFGLLRDCYQLWRTPEYTLFWRHATAW
jgi:hypothetical protein